MDGGSTDQTMQRVAPGVDHFACAVSEKDNGQADAVARGFEKCGNVDPSDRFALDYDLFVRYMRGGQARTSPQAMARAV